VSNNSSTAIIIPRKSRREDFLKKYSFIYFKQRVVAK
jgi:hypothetical protein